MRALSRAEELFSTRCPGTSAEMRVCRTSMGYLIVCFCQLERLPNIEQWAAEAEDHEDLLAGTRLRLLSTFRLLVADEPERAMDELRQAMARWGRERADTTAMLHGWAEAKIALYRADRDACRDVVLQSDAFFRSTLAAVPSLRGDALLSRARVALVASPGTGSQKELLQRVEEDARAAATLRLACLEPHIRLIRAGLAVRRGDADTALAMLETLLADHGDQPDLVFTMAAAEHRKGWLEGTAEGRARMAKSEATLREHGIENPGAFMRLFAPGFEGI
jgi:hypothetical protein